MNNDFFDTARLMHRDSLDAIRAINGCPRTETTTNTFALEQDPRTGVVPVTPPTAPTRNLDITSFPARLVQGAIATGAAIGVVIGATLNTNLFITSFVGGVGAGIGSVATSVDRKDPRKEAKKLLSEMGKQYALSGDVDKLSIVKQIEGDL